MDISTSPGNSSSGLIDGSGSKPGEFMVSTSCEEVMSRKSGKHLLGNLRSLFYRESARKLLKL